MKLKKRQTIDLKITKLDKTSLELYETILTKIQDELDKVEGLKTRLMTDNEEIRLTVFLDYSNV